MKKQSFLIIATLLLLWGSADAQTAKVNEPCKQLPCELELNCVELKDGNKKCAACTQSELNDLSAKVEELCKTLMQGWTPEKSAEYTEALTTDGRVVVDIYDQLLEKAKQCKQARITRDEKCFKGGDAEHREQLKQVATSIERMAEHKYQMISAKRVFYCAKNYYEGYLSTFNSKCNLNFPDINQKLDIMNNEQAKGTKVDCKSIESYSNDCERCLIAAKDLLYYAFSNSSDKFPKDYQEVYNKTEISFKKAKALQETINGKTLCD